MYINGKLYLLWSEYFSKFPFIFLTKTTVFDNIKRHLEEVFAVEGTLDDGPPFNGKKFKASNIQHHHPCYPQSNGFIEQ